jgi:hypothetical protein
MPGPERDGRGRVKCCPVRDPGDAKRSALRDHDGVLGCRLARPNPRRRCASMPVRQGVEPAVWLLRALLSSAGTSSAPPAPGCSEGAKAGRSVDFDTRAVPDGGVGGARGAWSHRGAVDRHMSGWLAFPWCLLGAGSCGVVGLGGRRLQACRCSRGRRASGSDSEARDRPAAVPQRHPSGSGPILTLGDLCPPPTQPVTRPTDPSVSSLLSVYGTQTPAIGVASNTSRPYGQDSQPKPVYHRRRDMRHEARGRGYWFDCGACSVPLRASPHRPGDRAPI